MVKPAPSIMKTDTDQATSFQLIDDALNKAQLRQDALIEILHRAQKSFGYLSEDILDYISLRLKLPPSMVYGVATFYDFFTLDPRGEHTCVVCLGTACYIKGAEPLMARLEDEFALSRESTTADGRLSLTSARCIGSCSLAPMLTFDQESLGPLTPDEAVITIRKKLAMKKV